MRKNYFGILSNEELKLNRSLKLSTEYNQVDWFRTLTGGVVDIWRSLTSDARATINHPGVLIHLMLGKLSDVASLLGSSDVGIVKMIYDQIQNKPSLSGISQKQILNGDINIYKHLFVEYKKVKIDDLDRYKQEFECFKVSLSNIKKNVCNKTKAYELSSSQIHDIKLFNPTKAKNEISNAIKYYESKNKNFATFAQHVADYIIKELIEYIATNITE